VGGTAGRRWHWRRTGAVVAVVLAALLVVGCGGPPEQVRVVKDPVTGEAVVEIGTCEGESVDAVRLRVEGGPVLWEVRRIGDGPAVDRVEPGEPPAGFAQTVASTPPPPERYVQAEVELSGGGIESSSATYWPGPGTGPTITEVALEVAPGTTMIFPPLSFGTRADQASTDVHASAERNCALRPFAPSNGLLVVTLLGFAALCAGSLHWERVHRSRLEPRPFLESPWGILTGGSVLLCLLLLPGGGMRSEPRTYLWWGLVTAMAVVGVGWLTAGLRQGRAPKAREAAEWVLVMGFGLLVWLWTLLRGTFEGGFTQCGPPYTFDCYSSWFDRLSMVLPLVLGWFVAVRLAEGGRWRHLVHRPKPPASATRATGPR